MSKKSEQEILLISFINNFTNKTTLKYLKKNCWYTIHISSINTRIFFLCLSVCFKKLKWTVYKYRLWHPTNQMLNYRTIKYHTPCPVRNSIIATPPCSIVQQHREPVRMKIYCQHLLEAPVQPLSEISSCYLYEWRNNLDCSEKDYMPSQY